MTEVMWLCFCEVGSLAMQKDKEEARERSCCRDSSWAAATAPCLRETPAGRAVARAAAHLSSPPGGDNGGDNGDRGWKYSTRAG